MQILHLSGVFQRMGRLRLGAGREWPSVSSGPVVVCEPYTDLYKRQHDNMS